MQLLEFDFIVLKSLHYLCIGLNLEPKYIVYSWTTYGCNNYYGSDQICLQSSKICFREIHPEIIVDDFRHCNHI